jgi:hypothetical protein
VASSTVHRHFIYAPYPEFMESDFWGRKVLDMEFQDRLLFSFFVMLLAAAAAQTPLLSNLVP